MSTDEMTAIQAWARSAPDLPRSPGKPVAVACAYQRHGTPTRSAAINIATGTAGGGVGETRTAADRARLIEGVIQHHPG